MKKVQLSEWQVRDRHGYTICGNEMSDSLKRCAVILLGRSRPAGFQKRERSYHAGYELRPISLLGTQVVAGQNYRFLCYGAGPAGKDLFVVDIYRNVKGKCSISSCKSLDLEKYIN